MKKIIFALMFAASTANAASMITANKNGGFISVTDEVCYLKGKEYQSLKQGYAVGESGLSIRGCWYYKDNLIHMIYEDGSEYKYPISGFTVVKGDL